MDPSLPIGSHEPAACDIGEGGALIGCLKQYNPELLSRRPSEGVTLALAPQSGTYPLHLKAAISAAGFLRRDRIYGM
ncbi:hypothetical protein SAMN04488498_1832 [Mesorhizobium albiziae]|uniref:Uncharacterized protein n=1 Tax=Neomesorhizobium albiziae TaxID=335020 RepID=A0A1I4G5K8_9HYPH|nr:hypothetical protein SAMN04488498_1832 [Mesorhizobium albiziae]